MGKQRNPFGMILFFPLCLDHHLKAWFSERGQIISNWLILRYNLRRCFHYRLVHEVIRRNSIGGRYWLAAGYSVGRHAT
jgi:hypothetical protein